MRTTLLLAGWLACATTHAAVVYDFTPVTQQIGGFLQANADMQGASLVVLRNGSVIYEDYFGTFTPATQVLIASASKWLAALAVERLVESGQMHWTDTIGQYLPAAPSDKQSITLAQLFSHTAGLTHVDDACLGNHFDFTLASCVDEILATPLDAQPGTAFAYTGNGMQVGGRMVELATGKSWAQVFAEQVTTPLAMSATHYSGANANPQIAGGVISTVADYSHVVQMIAAHGEWNGMAYLSAADVAEMQLDQTHGVPATYTPDPFAFGYGFGEWRNSVDAQGAAVQVSSTGAFGTSPWVNNRSGVAAVFLTSSQDLAKSDIRSLWQTVDAVVTDPVFADGFEAAR